MPLDDGYGFVRGTLTKFFPDSPENEGRYFHINVRVDAAGDVYRGAIDVDSKKSNIGVEWRFVTLVASELGPVLAMGVGYHALKRVPGSGAIDYIRSPVFARRRDAWNKGTNRDAYAALKPFLVSNQGRSDGMMLFGEPFTRGLGLHNIHQNQGDPLDSQWAQANGIWQDGCTLLEQSDGSWVAFLNKFSSQSYRTDDQGNPVVS
jgi:uncharacterized protein YukJ